MMVRATLSEESSRSRASASHREHSSPSGVVEPERLAFASPPCALEHELVVLAQRVYTHAHSRLVRVVEAHLLCRVNTILFQTAIIPIATQDRSPLSKKT